MARVTVHLHGVPKEKANRELIEMYSKRISSRGIRIEYHSDKMGVDAYTDFLGKRKGTVIYLDEGGIMLDSLEFSSRVQEWNIAGDETHLAIGPAQGWSSDNMPTNAQRLSLSKMTYPHELASVLLVEQLYRATEILRGSAYHKA
ncbi:MAG: 23S rRNA (pseudouridine(1915)-N(3))-methyltransferase RlmH [Candidatus Poseidoniaceae archaeon]|nr:23S rRNA (pseudouridine(1915)-N(3))-methyltransferase RlmH [Candidatus Poseidoniaceae archaeon]|tara:strand:- start:2734 stop:3168 length:435 start_codon:yes stop_codon:yes gene_type:complete